MSDAKVAQRQPNLLWDWVEIYRSSPPKAEVIGSISVEHATINGNVLLQPSFVKVTHCHCT